jgi:hypothetical protein
MKCMNAALTGALIVLLCGCSRGLKAGEVHVNEADAASVGADVAAQNRLNAFFYVAVLPKVQSCWNRLQGKGEIGFKYTYRRSEPTGQEVEKSDIAKNQEPIALRA